MAASELTVEAGQFASGIPVLGLCGILDAETFPQLDTGIQDVFQTGQYSLIIDVSRLDYITSAGVGAFVGHLNAAREHGGELVLLGLEDNDGVHRVFELLGMLDLFPHVIEMDDALDRLRK